jgi:hypothetical protein
MIVWKNAGRFAALYRATCNAHQSMLTQAPASNYLNEAGCLQFMRRARNIFRIDSLCVARTGMHRVNTQPPPRVKP